MATTQATYVVNADLGENGRLVLRSHEDVADWVNTEINNWQWLTSQTNDNALQQASQKITHPLVQIRKINQECINRQGTPQYEPQLNGLREHVGRLARETIVSNSARAKFLEQIKEESGNREAAYAAAMFLNVGVAANNPHAIRGTVDAVLYERGIKRSAKPEKRVLEKLKADFEEDWADYRAKYEDLGEQFSLLKEEIEVTRTSKEKEFSDALIEKVNEFDETKNSVDEEWKNIRAAYLDHMALEAPVDYWGKQKELHKGLAKTYAVASVVVAATGSVGLWFLADWLLVGEAEKWAGFPGVTLLGLPLWHVVIFSVFGSLGVWALRVLVRLLMSEMHLMTDAGERVVMALTYQALVKEGQGPQEGDRSLILQTLFRPSSTGVLKEEPSPVMPVEWISKFLGK